MEELKLDVRILSIEELEKANKEFQPKFNSTHEGYAILKEEVEEASDELEEVQDQLKYMWDGIKRNNSTFYTTEIAKRMKTYAINLSAESIQVAAMCQKFIDSFKK